MKDFLEKLNQIKIYSPTLSNEWSSFVNDVEKLLECLQYYAQKHGKNSKAAVLLKELGIE